MLSGGPAGFSFGAPPAAANSQWLLCRLIVFFAALLSGALGYSSGAPDSRCYSMVPGHGQPSGTYANPFRVTVSSSTYSPLQLLTVTIEPTVSVDNVYIRGFLVQARPANDRESGTRLGFFLSGSGSNTACNSGAVTHSYATDRSSVTVSWRAPAVPQGDLVFRATVVRTYSDFYTGVDSSVISAQIITTPPPTTTTKPTTTTSTTTTTTTTPPPPPPSTTTTTPSAATTKSTSVATTTTTASTTIVSETTTSSAQSSSTTAAPVSLTSQGTSSSESSSLSSEVSTDDTATVPESNTDPVGEAGLARCNALYLLLMLMMVMLVSRVML